jgi:hypothetical protein
MNKVKNYFNYFNLIDAKKHKNFKRNTLIFSYVHGIIVIRAVNSMVEYWLTE